MTPTGAASAAASDLAHLARAVGRYEAMASAQLAIEMTRIADRRAAEQAVRDAEAPILRRFRRAMRRHERRARRMRHKWISPMWFNFVADEIMDVRHYVCHGTVTPDGALKWLKHSRGETPASDGETLRWFFDRAAEAVERYVAAMAGLEPAREACRTNRMRDAERAVEAAMPGFMAAWETRPAKEDAV